MLMGRCLTRHIRILFQERYTTWHIRPTSTCRFNCIIFFFANWRDGRWFLCFLFFPSKHFCADRIEISSSRFANMLETTKAPPNEVSNSSQRKLHFDKSLDYVCGTGNQYTTSFARERFAPTQRHDFFLKCLINDLINNLVNNLVKIVKLLS